jgi:hypothetical protein
MLILATVFALAAGGSAFAQAPVGTAFTYQAQLKLDGELLNDSADFRFTLWDDPNSMDPNDLVAGPVPANNVDVRNGLFTIMVDFGVEPWVRNQARWLEIEVRSPSGAGGFTTLEPRQELAPTPFSLATRGICVDADGNVGIGTDAPTDKLHVMGALRVGNSIHIDDTTDTITSTSGTISFDNENLITMGDVGIGDADPLAELHVQGVLGLGLDPNDVFARENVLVEAGYAWLGLHSRKTSDYGSGLTFAEHDQSTGDLTDVWSIYRKSSAGGGDLKITYGSDTDPTANAQQLCIRPDGTTLLVPRTGKVGVGISATDDPAARLHLQEGLYGVPGAQGFLASFENNIFVEADRPWLSMYTDNEPGHDAGICFGRIDQWFDLHTKWAIYRAPGDDLCITHGNEQDPTENEKVFQIVDDGDTLLAPEHGDVGVGLDGDPLAKLHVQGLSGVGLEPGDVFDKEDILVDGGYAWLGLHSADAYNYGSGLTFAEHDVATGPTNTWAIYRRSTGNVGDLNITYGSNINPTANEKKLLIHPDGIVSVYGNVRIYDSATDDLVMELGTGLDYAEGFDVTDSESVAPGCVLVIDPDHAGELTISTTAYDTKVAGIVAGANGRGSGVRLGAGLFEHDVALAGRVYCNVDATYGAVQPGDLLTTSPTRGHAMVVKDYNEAQGAILGKAMEPLAEGQRGQILVLVTLQ